MALAAILLGPSVAVAAIEPDLKYELSRQDRKSPYYHVMIGLNFDQQVAAKAEGLKTFEKTETKILEGIVGEYVPGAVWSSGMGQLQVHIRRSAIEKLDSMTEVRNLQVANDRPFLVDPDNDFLAIEKEIESNGSARVNIIPEGTGVAWMMGKSGKSKFKLASDGERVNLAEKKIPWLPELHVGLIVHRQPCQVHFHLKTR